MLLKRFLADERGATAVEYGLIVGVLSLAIVGGFATVSNALQAQWISLANYFDGTAN